MVQAFLTALAASDFTTALSHLFPTILPAVEQALQDPKTAAHMAQDAGAISAVLPIQIGEFSALVTGERTTSSGTEHSEFLLERDPTSGRWQLTAF